jgi:hypothetical protein
MGKRGLAMRSSSVSLNSRSGWRPTRPASGRIIRRVLRTSRARSGGENNQSAGLIDWLLILSSPLWLFALILLWIVSWMLWLGLSAILLVARSIAEIRSYR